LLDSGRLENHFEMRSYLGYDSKRFRKSVDPISLYTFVSCNKYQVRDKSTDRPSVFPYQPMDIECYIPEESNIVSDSRNISTANDFSINNSDMSVNNVDGILTFTITMAKSDFNNHDNLQNIQTKR